MTKNVVTPASLVEYQIARAGISALVREYRISLESEVNRNLSTDLKIKDHTFSCGGVNFVTFFENDSFDRNGRSGKWITSHNPTLLDLQREVLAKVEQYENTLRGQSPIIDIVETAQERFKSIFIDLNRKVEQAESHCEWVFSDYLDADCESSQGLMLTVGYDDYYSDDYMTYYESAVQNFCDMVEENQ